MPYPTAAGSLRSLPRRDARAAETTDSRHHLFTTTLVFNFFNLLRASSEVWRSRRVDARATIPPRNLSSLPDAFVEKEEEGETCRALLRTLERENCRGGAACGRSFFTMASVTETHTKTQRFIFIFIFTPPRLLSFFWGGKRTDESESLAKAPKKKPQNRPPDRIFNGHIFYFFCWLEKGKGGRETKKNKVYLSVTGERGFNDDDDAAQALTHTKMDTM